jgi:hypothetical protein
VPAVTPVRARWSPCGAAFRLTALPLLGSLVLAGAPALAQTPSPGNGPGVPLPAGELAPRGGRVDAGRGAALTARYRVRQMENVLERAVQHAADLMRRRLRAVTPDVLALAGAPRAQGFRIDGYGLFFSVEVPRLSESVNWALRALSQDRDERVLASLRKVAASEQDPVVRADLERAIRTVEMQLSATPRPPAVVQAQRRPLTTAQAALERPTEAAMVADRSSAMPPQPPAPVAPPASAQLSPAPAAPPPPEVAAEAMLDPSVAYEDEVKQALVDAMLDYATSLDLPAAEWVTVAARDAGYVAFPDAVTDMVTVTLSVRVSDLVEFRAQRLTRGEARTRVVVREF